MNDLFIVLLLISFFSFFIALIKPSVFQKIFKDKATRKNLSLYFGSAFILFFILVGTTATPVQRPADKNIKTIEQQNNSTQQNKQVDIKKTEKLKNDYTKDIGKIFCNATNNICGGTIIEVHTCINDKSQQCYLVDQGEGYSRPLDHPVSNSYAKEGTETIPQKIEITSQSNLISLIENTVKTNGNFEVTIWLPNGNIANNESKPPFEIIVNTSINQIQDCFDAKNKLFNIMKSIYTDDIIKDKISRIKFTAWGQLKGSLGSKDASFNWNTSGPSNFWKVLQQYKSFEDESTLLNQRTYGIHINKECE